MTYRHPSQASGNGHLPENDPPIILIIDDTFDNLAIAQAALVHAGARVYTATSASEGFALLRDITPTVILLDIRLPEINGREIFHTLRTDPRTQSIPVIAFTAFAMRGDREQFLSEGFDGYIAKPFDVLTLYSQVRDILNSMNAK